MNCVGKRKYGGDKWCEIKNRKKHSKSLQTGSEVLKVAYKRIINQLRKSLL